MLARNIEPLVKSLQDQFSDTTIQQLTADAGLKKPRQLVDSSRIIERKERLREADLRPSNTAVERIMGDNDLVDIFYLKKGLHAAKSVCRIILKSPNNREIGHATGFKVSPNLVLTNHHVFQQTELLEHSLLEFNYELDINGNPQPTTRFRLNPAVFFHSDQELDFALIAIAPEPVYGHGRLSDFQYLRLNPELGKILEGEYATIIQHPGGDHKQLALRENKVLQITDRYLVYHSDTAQGSSGSPVFNDSWQVVGLHSSGVPQKNKKGEWLLKNGNVFNPEEDDDSDVAWIANMGIRISLIVKHVFDHGPHSPLSEEFKRICMDDRPPVYREDAPTLTSVGSSIPESYHGADGQLTLQKTIHVPIQISVALGQFTAGIEGQVNDWNMGPSTSIHPSNSDEAPEAKKEPIHDPHYSNRRGYDPNFLNQPVPLPKVRRRSTISQGPDGGIYIPYHHFTIVNDKSRRLALFAASNLDASPDKREPEPGKSYDRKSLAGLGKKDTEKWFIDPRIPLEDQLSDEFYSWDREAFDKGHIVRRDDVAWGSTYQEVQLANGDSFHITNCSPQVAAFNQSSKGGLWGKLENEVMKQHNNKRCSLFAGPVFDANDPVFQGVDANGLSVAVQIPRAYWKMILTTAEDHSLRVFAFVLQQDLSNVQFEFDSSKWNVYSLSVRKLEKQLQNISFPRVVKEADQFKKPPLENLINREREVLLLED